MRYLNSDRTRFGDCSTEHAGARNEELAIFGRFQAPAAILVGPFYVATAGHPHRPAGDRGAAERTPRYHRGVRDAGRQGAAAAEAARATGIDVIAALDELPDACVDSAISLHAIEHVDAPLEILGGLQRAVRLGGRRLIVPRELSLPWAERPRKKPANPKRPSQVRAPCLPAPQGTDGAVPPRTTERRCSDRCFLAGAEPVRPTDFLHMGASHVRNSGGDT